MRLRLRFRILAILSAIVTAGCGGGSGGIDDGATTPGSVPVCVQDVVPVLCSDWKVSGGSAVTGHSAGLIGSFNSYGLSCEAWAAGKDLRDDGMLELAALFEPIDHSDVDLYTGIAGYSGPGSYDIASLAGLGGDPFAITVGEFAFQASAESTATLTLHDDGAGTLTFANFMDTGGPEPAAPGIAGTVSWTCVDPK